MITLFKKSIFVLAICGATLCSFAADVKPYVNADALPNALNFYPAPPETTSVQFMYDISQYMWGKSMRADSARAALAIAQSTHNLEDMVKMFSEPFGMEVSATKTPAIMNAAMMTVMIMHMENALRALFLSPAPRCWAQMI